MTITIEKRELQTIGDFDLERKSLLLELLKNDLDFHNGREKLSRHYWHSFPAKFPPELPRRFIQILTKPCEIVLDPMAGSGTTLLESIYLKRRAYGLEIDPLSLLIVKAKLQNIDRLYSLEIGNTILKNAKFTISNDKTKLTELLKSRFDAKTLEFLEYWYDEKTQLELLALIVEIEKVQNSNTKDFLKLIFSSIIITKSGGVSLSYDLAHTRPHKVAFKKINSAILEFEKKLNRILTNGYLDIASDFVLLNANAKQIPFEDNSVDLIVTSPPYANNAIDYMRAHKFSLVWFKHTVDQLKFLRKEYIGAESKLDHSILKLPEITNSIVKTMKIVDNSKGNSLERYYSEILKVFSEMYRVLKPKRACILVVATSVLKGVDVEIEKCLKEIGQQVGFEFVYSGTRNIHRDRRMMPARNHRKNISQIENRMHSEYVIGFWKN